MTGNRLVVITDSPDVRSVVCSLVEAFQEVQTTWCDSLSSAQPALEQSATGVLVKPDVIVADLNMAEFKDLYLRNEFSRWSDGTVALAILPESISDESAPLHFLDNLNFFDIIRRPLVPLEIRYRLRAALAFARRLAKRPFFEAAVKEAGLGCFIIDESRKILRANPMAERLFGDAAGTLPVSDMPFSPAIQEIAANKPDNLNASATAKQEKNPETVFLTGCFADSFDLPTGNRAIIFFHDATWNILREGERRLSAKVLFEYRDDAIIITDDDGRIQEIADTFTGITGYSVAEVFGTPFDFLKSGKHVEPFYGDIYAITHPGSHRDGTMGSHRKSGAIFPQWIAVTAVQNSAGELDHYVTLLSDITGRWTEERHLRHLAYHDFLTALPNRVLLRDRFRQAAATARRHGGRLALMFIDLDAFKTINDRHGHLIGDRLLLKMAERLLMSLRATDTLSRWGGDEFVLLFTGVKSVEETLVLAEKVVHALQTPFEVKGLELTLSASIGISLYPDHGLDLEQLLARADAAMYAAKELTDNAFVLFAEKGKDGVPA